MSKFNVGDMVGYNRRLYKVLKVYPPSTTTDESYNPYSYDIVEPNDTRGYSKTRVNEDQLKRYIPASAPAAGRRKKTRGKSQKRSTRKKRVM